jgi:hypothetical protein
MTATANWQEELERYVATRLSESETVQSWRERIAAETARAEEARRDASIDEKAEQRAVVSRLRAFGFVVYSLSQARAAKQTPGIPDLWIVHRRLAWAGWFETKRQVGGKHSTAQLEFRSECDATGVNYRTGDRHVAELLLIELGLAERGPDGNLEPKRRSA